MTTSNAGQIGRQTLERSGAGSRGPRWKLAIVVGVTVVMAILIATHAKRVNGPAYWVWPWRNLGAWPLYALMAAAGAPCAIGQWLFARGRWKLALVCVTVSCFALQMAAIASQPPVGGRRLLLQVQHTFNTSYWTDAVVIDKQENIPLIDWLGQFHDIVPMLHYHARYKPPGLMFYYLFWVRLLGRGDASAWAGGIGIAVLAALAVPAAYRMLHFHLRDRPAAFFGASFLAMCPSLVLFLPQFDQVYVLIACGIVLLWGRAARDGSIIAAVLLGALLALALFMSYIFLVLGCFIVTYWMLLPLEGERGVRKFWRAAALGVVSLAVVGVIYAILSAATGFDPIATYRSIADRQMKDLIHLGRPFPVHIAWDLYDFTLGAGFVGVVMAMLHLARGRGALRERFVLAGMIQIATVALAALLPGEAARLWMLMLPLLMAPVGLELASWPTRHRAIAFACLWVMLVLIAQHMNFLYMGPQYDGHGGPFDG